jgi:hypothetical protein
MAIKTDNLEALKYLVCEGADIDINKKCRQLLISSLHYEIAVQIKC